MSEHVKDIQLNPVKSTLMLSIPIILLLFLNSLYAIIDIYWMDGLGTEAVICMGYIANFIYVINKIGDGIGRSANVLISNAFGAEEFEKTSIYAGHGLLLILFFSVAFPLFIIPFINPICAMADIPEYAGMIYAYLAPLLGLVFFIMMSNYFCVILGSEGDTKRATIIVAVGNLINVVLDPILMFNMGLGMTGAALATVIGSAVSLFLFYYLYSVRKDTLVKINLRGLKFDFKILKEIIFLAVPIILDSVVLSAVGVIIVYALEIFASPDVIFSYIILLSIQTSIFTPVQGIAKGLGIVTGHLSGAKRFTELKKTIRKIFLLALAISLAIAFLLAVFHTPIISIFSTENVVMAEVRNQLIFVIITIITLPIIMGCSYVFLGLEKSIYTLIFIIFNFAVLLASLGIFSYVLSMGTLGIFLSIILSNLIQAAVMLLVLRRMLNTRILAFESKGSSEDISAI